MRTIFRTSHHTMGELRGTSVFESIQQQSVICNLQQISKTYEIIFQFKLKSSSS